MTTTYVFGAGASIHAGYPLASKMGEDLLDFMLKYPLEKYQQSGQFIIESFGKSPNIEDLISEMEAEIESLRGDSMRAVFGNALGDLAVMLREWFRVIHNTPARLYAAFANKIIKSGDTVITFNYDDSLDRELKRVGLWDLSRGYGFPLGSADKRSEVLMLKLHGSINWMIELFGGALSGPVVAGPQGASGGSPVIHLADANYLGYTEFSGRTYSGGGTSMKTLILPGRCKRFYIDTSLGREFEEFWNHLWFQGAEVLKRTDKLILCGYSMPPVDQRARDLLLQAPQKEIQVTIISGKQSEDIAKAFSAAGFQNVEAFNGGYFEQWLQSQNSLAASG